MAPCLCAVGDLASSVRTELGSLAVILGHGVVPIRSGTIGWVRPHGRTAEALCTCSARVTRYSEFDLPLMEAESQLTLDPGSGRPG